MIRTDDFRHRDRGFPAWRPVRIESINAPVRFAYLLFVFTIPMETIYLGLPNTYFSLAKAAAYLMIFMSLMQIDLCLRRVPKVAWWFIVYLLVLCFLAKMGEPDYFIAAMIRVTQLGQLLVLFVVTFNLFRAPDMMLQSVKAIIYSTSMLSILEMIGIARTIDNTADNRVTVLDQNGNNWGAIVAVALILLIGLTFRPNARGDWRSWNNISLFTILSLELLRTGSRSALLGLLCGLVLFLTQGKGFNRRVKTIVITLASVTLLVIGAYELQGSRWAAASRGRFSGREDIIPAALQMIEEKPFFGWGPVTNIHELGSRAKGVPRLDTHNLPLWVLTETGVVGAIPFLGAWAACLYTAWRARTGRLGILPFAVNVCFFIVNQANTFHNLKLFWICLALGSAAGTFPVYRSKNERVHSLRSAPGFMVASAKVVP